jgi:hypothetical protein
MMQSQPFENTGSFVEFGGRRYGVVKSHYPSTNTIALVLVNPDNPQYDNLRITINIPGVKLADGEVLVKTWDENMGLLEILEREGVLNRTGRVMETGDPEESPAFCKVLV